MWHLGGDFRVANLLDVEVRERKEKAGGGPGLWLRGRADSGASL